MRTPEEIIDAVAAARGMVVPVRPHMALGPDFVRACMAERDAEIARAFHLPAHPRPSPEPVPGTLPEDRNG